MISLPVQLPPGFTSLVTAGDTIRSGQTIAQKTTNNEQVINIAEQLEIPLKKVKNVLQKNPGDEVQVGDVIALKKGFFNSHQVISRVNGTVERYERQTGNLVIRTSAHVVTEKLISPVDGTITLCDNNKIVIGTEKNVAVGIRGIGQKAEGELFILEASFIEGTNDAIFHLDSRAIGKIVVGNKLSRDVLVKGISIGAIAFIGVEIAEEDFEHLVGKNLTIPVLAVDDNTIQRLTSWKGQKVFVDGEGKAIIFLQI